MKVLDRDIVDEKQRRYYHIYEEFYENPDISLSEIAVNTGIPEGDCEKTLNDMYAHGILIPYMAVKPTSTCVEYVDFLEFSHVTSIFPKLENHPYVTSFVPCEGAWNVLVTAPHLVCFNEMTEDFCVALYQGRKGKTVTPKCKSDYQVNNLFKVEDISYNPGNTVDSVCYKYATDLQKEITSCKESTAWEEIKKYYSFHILFYPLGFCNYTHWFFLLEKNPVSLFEDWPCSCFFCDVGCYVLARISVPVQNQLHVHQIIEDAGIFGFSAAPVINTPDDIYNFLSW
jgi:hypothetical protein